MTYDSWKCSAPEMAADFDDYDPNEQEPDEMATEQDEDCMRDALTMIKVSTARELRLLTAAVNARREQLERELRSELSELGNVDKAPRAKRSDAGKPRLGKRAANDTTPDADPFAKAEVSR